MVWFFSNNRDTRCASSVRTLVSLVRIPLPILLLLLDDENEHLFKQWGVKFPSIDIKIKQGTCDELYRRSATQQRTREDKIHE